MQMQSSHCCLGFSSAAQRTAEHSSHFLFVTCTDATIVHVHLCSLIILNLNVLSFKSFYIASVSWKWHALMHLNLHMHRKSCGYIKPNTRWAPVLFLLPTCCGPLRRNACFSRPWALQLYFFPLNQMEILIAHRYRIIFLTTTGRKNEK